MCGCVGFDPWKKDNDYGCVYVLGWILLCNFLCFAGCSCRFEFAAPFVGRLCLVLFPPLCVVIAGLFIEDGVLVTKD